MVFLVTCCISKLSRYHITITLLFTIPFSNLFTIAVETHYTATGIRLNNTNAISKSSDGNTNHVQSISVDRSKNKDNVFDTSGYKQLGTLHDKKIHSGRYYPMNRPVYNQSEPVVLDAVLRIFELVSIDDVSQQMVTSVTLMLKWEDKLLTWDPEDFGGLRSLTPRLGSIWKPELTLLNSLERQEALGWKSLISPRVNYTGWVVWSFDSVFKTSCSLNMTTFPFDVQTCVIAIAPSFQPQSEVDFRLSRHDIDTDFIDKTCGWQLVETYTFSETLIVDDWPVSIAKFTVKFRRKSVYFILTILAPNVALSFLHCFVFFLPSNCGEKLSLGTSVLLALTVSMSSTSDKLPSSTEDIPAIVIYLGLLMLNSIAAVILTIVNSSLLRRVSSKQNDPIEKNVHAIQSGEQNDINDSQRTQESVNSEVGESKPPSFSCIRGKDTSTGWRCGFFKKLAKPRLDYLNFFGFVFFLCCWCMSTGWYINCVTG